MRRSRMGKVTLLLQDVIVGETHYHDTNDRQEDLTLPSL